MKIFFRMVLLLGFVGLSYGLGRRQGGHVIQAQTAEAARQQKAALAAKARQGPSYTEFETLRALLTNPNLSWKEKNDRLYADSYHSLFSEINPADVPNLIRLIEDLPALGDDLAVKKSLLDDLFDQLGNKDPMLTLSLLEDYPDPRERTYKMAGALGVLAATDPQKAFGMLAELPNYTTYYGPFFGTWAGEDPVAAATAALNLPPGSKREYAMEEVSGTWSQSNPLAEINWAKNLPITGTSRNDARAQAIFDAVEALAESRKWDMAIALDALNSIPNPSVRDNLIEDATGSLAIQNPTAAMEFINQTAAPGTSAYYDGINDVFGALTPGINLNSGNISVLLNKISDPDARAVAINAIAGGFAQWQQDSDTGLPWAQALPDADATARTGALNTILTALSKTNPIAAAAFVQNAADPSAYLSAAPAIAQNLAVGDPQGALDWAGNLPDGTGKDQAIGNVLAIMAQTDAASAWNYAASLPAGGDQDAVMTGIVTGIAGRNPAEAASLAEQMPDGSAQVSAITSVSATWVAQDPQAFATWMNGLPAGGPRDAAVAQLVASAQTAKAPATVLAWANSVGDPQARASEIATVVTAWAKNDPAAALNAAQTANLTDAQRAALVQKITQVTASK